MNNSKENRIMKYNYLKDSELRDRGDIENMLKLYELTDEEVIATTGKLIAWMQDGNWYYADPMVVFLIKKQDLIIERLKELLEMKQDDGIWKYWVILKLMPYLSFENQEKLIPAVRSVGISPTDEGACREAFDAAIDAVTEYRNREKRISGSCSDCAKLYALSDTDVRYVIRKKLQYYISWREMLHHYRDWDEQTYNNLVKFYKTAYDDQETIHTKWKKEYFLRSFIIAKQDVVVDDIRDVYLSDEYSQYYKQLIYDNIIIFFTKENQEKILGKAVK